MRNLIIGFLVVFAGIAAAQTNPTSETANASPGGDSSTATPVLQIDAGKVAGKVSPELYGLMTEELNFSYEGGIYGELIRNHGLSTNFTREFPPYSITVLKLKTR